MLGGVTRAKTRETRGNTYSKLRVNGLVGDVVGNVLDLRIVLARSRSHGRSAGESGDGGREVTGGGDGAGDASSTDGGRAESEVCSEAGRLGAKLLGRGSQAAGDGRHCFVEEGRGQLRVATQNLPFSEFVKESCDEEGEPGVTESG